MSLPAEVHQVAATRWEDVKQYCLTPSKGMPLHLGLFLVLALLLCVVRRQVHLWAATDTASSAATTAFDRPYSSAFIVFAFVVTGHNSSMPSTVQQLITLAAVVPMIRVVASVADSKVTRGLCIIGLFFPLMVMRQAVAGTPWLEQVIVTLETAAGIAVLDGRWLGDTSGVRLKM